MRFFEWGRIVKGVNTTPDVGVNEIPRQAKKFGNTVDKDGRPPTLSKKVKGKSTNVLFNLGLTEGVKLRFQRGEDFDTLHIKPKNKNRVELRGKTGYESGNYDAQDKLHQVLDQLGKAANFAELMNGEVVSINPKHPDGERANRTVKDVLSTESISKDELRKQLAMGIEVEMEHTDNPKLAMKIAMDHIKEDPKYYDKLKFIHDEQVEEKWSAKYKRSINCSNPKGFSQKAHCAGRNKNEAQELSMTSEIYVDMDGVLADFFGDWAKLMGKDHWTKIDDISPALQKIRDTEDFWLNLPLTDNAKNLLTLIKDVKGEYNILSSPLPDDPNSEPHKREWIKKNLNFFLPKNVIITHDKARYATSQDGTPNILIDDYGQNIAKWESAGGIGFKHKDHKFERTAKAIKQHMQEPVEERELTNGEDEDDPFVNAIDKSFGQGTIAKKIGFSPTGELYKAIYRAIKAIMPEADEAEVKKAANAAANSMQESIQERELTKGEEKDKEKYVKGMKKNKKDFKKRYGDDAEAVMYATATKMAKEALRSGRYTPDQILEILENFADGKVKGKSRPGRVKRAGASCSGSVTELRKKAKNASGERAKMYHWCANMKAGRNK